LVVAERDVGWQRAVDVELAAIFENEPGRGRDLDSLTGAPHENGGRRGCVALGTHRATQRLARRRGKGAPFAESVVVAVGDAPRICHPGHSTRGRKSPARYARFFARADRRRLEAFKIASRSAPGDRRNGAHRSPTRRTRAGSVVSVKSR